MKTIYLIISLILLTACQDSSDQEEREIVGGDPCTYESHIEQATISSFEYLENPSPCSNGVQLHFTLEERTDTPQSSSTRDYAYDMPYSGEFPSQTYFESKGLTIGSTHDINISTILTGTCSPMIFEFVDINLSDRENYCME